MANKKRGKAVPVDLAWHPLQILLALDADNAFAEL
jgi:hypothetical protein